MNKKPFYNKDLFTQSKETSEIEILKFNHETLEKLGWVDEYGQPSGVFIEVVKYFNKQFPTEFGNNCQFWNPIEGGIDFYNIFLKDKENE